MGPWIAVLMMMAAGSIMSFQAPINAALRNHVGIVESSLVSFSVGTIALALIVAVWGQGNLGALRHVPWWNLLGGLIGAVFVTSTLLAVPKIGVTGMIVASLAGNLTAAVLIDANGWVGLSPRPIEGTRIVGVLFMVVSVVLINWTNWRKA